ncbi:MAG: glycosyltransferase family 2 protein [Pseudomonadota bacterium]
MPVAITIMGVVLVCLAGLIFLGENDLKKSLPSAPDRENDQPEPLAWPRVGMVIPAAGTDPVMADAVASRLNQDYPDFKVVLVGRSFDDPAAYVLQAAAAGRAHASFILSGTTKEGCQKNHGLLAGVAELGDFPEVLVFTDSTNVAPRDWLRELVRPIALGRGLVAGGYHHAIPMDQRIVSLGRALTVLGLGLTRGVWFLVQPWGGSTAISAKLFRELRVDRLWRDNMVDDVSLAKRLQEAKIQFISTPRARLETPLGCMTMGKWVEWLTRQLLYLKFAFPGTWAITCFLILAFLFLILASLSWLAFFPLGWSTAAQAFAGGGFLLIFTLLGARLRRLHPRSFPFFPWIAAFYLTFLTACWSFCLSGPTMNIVWRGFRYHIAWGGRVRSIHKLE